MTNSNDLREQVTALLKELESLVNETDLGRRAFRAAEIVTKLLAENLQRAYQDSLGGAYAAMIKGIEKHTHQLNFEPYALVWMLNYYPNPESWVGADLVVLQNSALTKRQDAEVERLKKLRSAKKDKVSPASQGANEEPAVAPDEPVITVAPRKRQPPFIAEFRELRERGVELCGVTEEDLLSPSRTLSIKFIEMAILLDGALTENAALRDQAVRSMTSVA